MASTTTTTAATTTQTRVSVGDGTANTSVVLCSDEVARSNQRVGGCGGAKC